jgi:hypothetical protein
MSKKIPNSNIQIPRNVQASGLKNQMPAAFEALMLENSLKVELLEFEQLSPAVLH